MLITQTIRPILKNYSSKFKLGPLPSNKIKTFWKILFLRPQEATKSSKDLFGPLGTVYINCPYEFFKPLKCQ